MLMFPVAYWTPSDLELNFQCHVFLPFYTVHEVLATGMLKWFAIPSSSGPHFVRTLHYEQLVLYSNLLFLLYWRAYIYRQTLATIKTWTVFWDCLYFPLLLHSPIFLKSLTELLSLDYNYQPCESRLRNEIDCTTALWYSIWLTPTSGFQSGSQIPPA